MTIDHLARAEAFRQSLTRHNMRPVRIGDWSHTRPGYYKNTGLQIPVDDPPPDRSITGYTVLAACVLILVVLA